MSDGASPEYRRLDRLTATDPALAWDGLVRFVGEGGHGLEAQSLLEDLVGRYPLRFVEAIELEAARSDQFAELVAMAHTGDVAGPEIERFRELQRRVRDRLGIDHWQGLMPFPPDEPGS